LTFSETLNAIKSYLAGFLTFTVLFSLAVVFLWDEYKEIQIQKETTSRQLLVIKDAELKLERDRSDLQIKFKEREFEISKKESQLEQAKKELEEKISNLERSASNDGKLSHISIQEKEAELDLIKEQYEIKFNEVKDLHAHYSQEAKKSKAEDLILNAMKEFSELGVNISRPDWCDKDYMGRYYKGKALIDQIYALNQKYSISDEYDWFVRKNTRSSTSFNDGVCEANKKLNSDAEKSAG